MPQLCSHCCVIGHTISSCKWLKNHPEDVSEHGKKIINIKKEATKESLQYVVKKKEALPGGNITNPVKIDLPTIEENQDEATDCQLDMANKNTKPVAQIQQLLVPPKPVITVAIPLKNDDRQIAQTLPTAEAVLVLLVDGPINHKTTNAAAVPYVKVDNPMPQLFHM
jgi:hypothetical protein